MRSPAKILVETTVGDRVGQATADRFVPRFLRKIRSRFSQDSPGRVDCQLAEGGEYLNNGARDIASTNLARYPQAK
jgi:enoyl reductase-like protein